MKYRFAHLHCRYPDAVETVVEVLVESELIGRRDVLAARLLRDDPELSTRQRLQGPLQLLLLYKSTLL